MSSRSTARTLEEVPASLANRRGGDRGPLRHAFSLGAIRMMAERLMQDYPQHGTACQAIIDFASDGGGI
jgi:hypothetical protein